MVMGLGLGLGLYLIDEGVEKGIPVVNMAEECFFYCQMCCLGFLTLKDLVPGLVTVSVELNQQYLLPSVVDFHARVAYFWTIL